MMVIHLCNVLPTLAVSPLVESMPSAKSLVPELFVNVLKDMRVIHLSGV